MIKILMPIVFLSVGLWAGIGVGIYMAPSEAPALEEAETKPEMAKDKSQKSGKAGKSDAFDYLKLTKQFVVPIVEDDKIAAMVTMSLSLEANPAITDTFYAIEPKLRDRFLQVLFDHANTGGFDGLFTQSDNLGALRKALLEVARKDLGNDVSQVLIMSVNRQDT